MSQTDLISRYVKNGAETMLPLAEVGLITDEQDVLYDQRVKYAIDKKLAARLSAEGQQDGIHVVLADKARRDAYGFKYLAFIGTRRVKAATSLGWTEIRARVADLTKLSEGEIKRLAVTSNTFRENDGLLVKALQVAHSVEVEKISFKDLALMWNESEQVLRRLAWFAEAKGIAKSLAGWVNDGLLTETDAVNFVTAIRGLEPKRQAEQFGKLEKAVDAATAVREKALSAIKVAAEKAPPVAKPAKEKIEKATKAATKTARKQVTEAVREVQAEKAKAKPKPATTAPLAPATLRGGHPDARYPALSFAEIDDIIMNVRTPPAVSTTLQVAFGIVEKKAAGNLLGCGFLKEIFKS